MAFVSHISSTSFFSISNYSVHDGDVLSEVLLGLLTLRKDNALEHHKLQKYVKCGLDQITVHLMAHKHKVG